MFHVTPDGILVFVIFWDGEFVQFPADFNWEGDRVWRIEDEQEWNLDWMPQVHKELIVRSGWGRN